MRNFLQKTSKFSRLPFSDKVQVLQLFVLLLLTKLLLKLLPFSSVMKIYKKSLNLKKREVPNYATTAKLLNYASSVMPQLFTCLPKAMVFKFLCRGSENLLLIIGVQKVAANTMSFHAWVQKNNEILINHTAEDHFTPLWEIN